jgi:ATP-dependent Clp protease protease subunit
MEDIRSQYLEAKKRKLELEAKLLEKEIESEEIRNKMLLEEVACEHFRAKQAELEYLKQKAAYDLFHQEHLEKLASDKYHRVYRFSSVVNENSCRACASQLYTWSRLDGDNPQPMTIIFLSPGGSVIDGLALFDTIQELRRKGHHITTSTNGYAASMAGILLQAGDVRIMSRESWLLIHEASFMAAGKIGDVEDHVEWVKKIVDRIAEIFAERSLQAKRAGTASVALSKAAIKRRMRRKDWWISAPEAVRMGLCDRIE